MSVLVVEVMEEGLLVETCTDVEVVSSPIGANGFARPGFVSGAIGRERSWSVVNDGLAKSVSSSLMDWTSRRRERNWLLLVVTLASADDVVTDGLRHFAIYHTRAAAERRGDRVFPTDRALLFYYQNRLEGFGLEQRTGLKPALTPDHRQLGRV